MATILIVEDNENVRLLTKLQLDKEYTVLEAENGVAAMEILRQRPVDLIVTDVMMPHMDGFTLVQRLREMNNTVPVVLLTAKQSQGDKRIGFAAGADDYITKPLDYEELLWRIQALLRRTQATREQQLVLGNVSICTQRYSVAREGHVEILPKKEFELLYLLLSHPGVVFTKLQLQDAIWGYDSISDESTIKTHINRLRRRFAEYKEFSIVTVRGLGYKGVVNC